MIPVRSDAFTSAQPAGTVARPLVFLHIPKTAGQTIHHSLAHAVGGGRFVSPVRLNGQAGPSASKMPPGYRLYSGHIDWVDLPNLANPFTFTVLRDPGERIASFYFFLRQQAFQDRAAPGPILTRTADDYFFGGDERWQHHILDHYDNFYCRYFATGRYNSAGAFAQIAPSERVSLAVEKLDAYVDGVYSTDTLAELEADLAREMGKSLSFANHFSNVGDLPRAQPRWPALLDRFETDAATQKISKFVELDALLMEAVGLA